MRKVINSTYVSLDGVVTNPQEWTFAFRDDAANQFAFEQLMACDALLMGRRTYEVFSEVWPTMKDEAGFADKMNSMGKHVASRLKAETASQDEVCCRAGLVSALVSSSVVRSAGARGGRH